MNRDAIPLRLLFALPLVMLAGCATPRNCAVDPWRIEQDRMNALVGATWDKPPAGSPHPGQPDPERLAAAETLLIHFSRGTNTATRAAAAAALLNLGTKPAWDRALEVAQTDPDAGLRSDLWVTLIGFLHTPPAAITNAPPNSTNSGPGTISSVLTNPDIRMELPDCCGHQRGFRKLPDGVEMAGLERAIIAQYQKDEGAWDIHCTDTNPLLPFISHSRIFTVTVRQSIAEEIILCCDSRNQTILEAFRTFSTSPDPAIRDPALEVVEALSIDWSSMPALLRIGP